MAPPWPQIPGNAYHGSPFQHQSRPVQAITPSRRQQEIETSQRQISPRSIAPRAPVHRTNHHAESSMEPTRRRHRHNEPSRSQTGSDGRQLAHTDQRRRRNSGRTSNRSQNPFPPLGTREDVEDPNYESPIGAMFGRAMNRYQNAEDVRQAQAHMSQDVRNHGGLYHNPDIWTTGVQDTSVTYPNPFQSNIINTAHGWNGRHSWNFENAPPQFGSHLPNPLVAGPHGHPQYSPISAHTHGQTLLDSQHAGLAHQLAQYDAAQRANALAQMRAQRPTQAQINQLTNRFTEAFPPVELDSRPAPRSQPTLDQQVRPSPRKPDDLKVDMSCKICMEQIADIILIPCRHLYMCHWCADIAMPPKGPQMAHVACKDAKCHMCRKYVKYRYEVYLPGANTDDKVVKGTTDNEAVAI